jgi:hypothetical protein
MGLVCSAYAHKNFVDDNLSQICYIILIYWGPWVTSKLFCHELTKISCTCCPLIQESIGTYDSQMQPRMKLWWISQGNFNLKLKLINVKIMDWVYIIGYHKLWFVFNFRTQYVKSKSYLAINPCSLTSHPICSQGQVLFNHPCSCLIVGMGKTWHSSKLWMNCPPLWWKIRKQQQIKCQGLKWLGPNPNFQTMQGCLLPRLKRKLCNLGWA